MGIFLERRYVEDDLNRFSVGIQERYQLDEVSGFILENDATGIVYGGYEIKSNGKAYAISMPYLKNELGELAIKEKIWTIKSNNFEETGYKTIGESVERIKELLV